MPDRDALIERLAAALYQAEEGHVPWDELRAEYKPAYRSQARAVLALLEREGLLREPTPREEVTEP